VVTPDPTLGFPTAFDKTGFEHAIRFAMQMGTPNDPDRAPVFIKKVTTLTYFEGSTEVAASSLRLDRDGRPLNPNIRVQKAADQSVTVDCAIEVARADADELPVGSFRPTKVIATLLDDDYALIDGCRELRYNGDTYIYGYEPEAYGLFDAGVHTIVFYALDES
jgi:hypothetical protein